MLTVTGSQRTRVWLPAVNASGVSFNVRIRNLRQAHASWLLAGGSDLKSVMDRLGHARIQTTQKYCTRSRNPTNGTSMHGTGSRVAGDDLDRRTATIGRVHPHVEIKIVDPATGEAVERGQTGEVCTRGFSVMLGYWDDPEKTRESIAEDGWMQTGHLAEMREDG